jgi:3-oxoacyl-[acyl-carrier-protein] synthase II
MSSTKDKMGRPLVVVTGLGVVTSLGAGKTDNWAKLTAGESGIRAISRFPTDGLKTRIAGTIDFLPAQDSTAALSESFADLAAEEAIAESGIGTRSDFPGPLFLAVPPIEIEWAQRLEVSAKSGANDTVTYSDMLRVSSGFPAFHQRFLFGSVANYLADKFGTKGSPISLSTACASGASAIQLGVEAIRRGETTAALCIGTDGSINPEALIRFSLLSALSTGNDTPQSASRPFSKNRDGFVMAEGAGALVLESYEAAKARGVKIIGVLEGCGEMTDAFHRTRSSPDGKPIIGCIAQAIKDAGLTPDHIDYINAHGTSTPYNDRTETQAIKLALGEAQAYRVRLSSTKSMTGHLAAAAGGIEAVASVLAMEHQCIPPTINYVTPDPECDLQVTPNKACAADIRVVLSNSFGLGGQNASAIFRKYEG